MATDVERIGANVPAPDGNGPGVPNDMSYIQKYALERGKRLGRGGLAQYIDLKKSEKLKCLLEDPWIGIGTPIQQVVPDSGHSKVVIVGAGYGGILFAVELLKKGFSVQDILIVDPAGGFGGTWYWNRYPGLMCDVEAYIYMPMLEEMGYMPKHKYAQGHELREYAESICKKYGLHSAGMFQSTVEGLTWSESDKQWNVDIAQKPKGGNVCNIHISADYVILANGLLNNAKVPNTQGSDEFQGTMFHSARWRYDVTGGSPEAPDMTNLQDKKVGIIGTGASAIQIVPALAKWSKELYVFQRTPSAVNPRNNRDTDPDLWKTQIANKPGWQRERNMNYFSHVGNQSPKPEIDLVDDGWTHMPSFSALIGGPSYQVSMENVQAHVEKLYALDKPHQDAVRKRATDIVQNPETASNLQAWYHCWCKRPCFHDEYLPAFNQPNVTLIDTSGRGIDRINATGILSNNTQYDLDILIWGTGFQSPGAGSAAARAAITLKGRNGLSLDEHYKPGMSTLHGVTSREFPNLFWPGPFQAGASPNQMFLLETLSQHIAYIISAANEKVGATAIIEPTKEGEEGWALRCLAGAPTFAAVASCTPGYINREGEADMFGSMEEKMKAARQSPWSKGIEDFVHVIEAWREEGKLEGLDVKARA